MERIRQDEGNASFIARSQSIQEESLTKPSLN